MLELWHAVWPWIDFPVIFALLLLAIYSLWCLPFAIVAAYV